MTSPERLKEACSRVARHDRVGEFRDIRQECVEDLKRLFQAGKITEPEHDECLDLLFKDTRTKAKDVIQ